MKRSALFIGFFLIVGIMLYKIGFSLSQPYENTYNQVQSIISGADTALAIKLGNSHSGSVDYTSLQLKGGVSMSAGFMDIFELYHLSEYLIPKLPNLKYALIAVPYYFFEFDNAAYQDSYQLSFRKRSYFMTPQLSLIGNDPENLFSAKISPIVRPDHWKGVFTTLLKSSIEKVAVLRPITLQKADSASLVKHAIGRVKQNKTQVDTMLYAHPDLPEESQQKLIEVIRLFKKHHIIPIFYTPSYHTFYTSRFDKDIKKRNLDRMKSIAVTEQVFYVDFSSDSVLSNTVDLYLDSDHYNEKGRAVFSKQLRDSLIQRGILKK